MKIASPPSNLSTEGIVLGENIYQKNKTLIRINRNDRRKHIYIIGQAGTGKTTLLKNMFQQDIQNGEGVCFIDPYGKVSEELLGLIPKERIEDVIYFNPADTKKPIGLNVLEYNPERPEDKTFIINILIEIIDKIYDLQTNGGPLFEQYLRNALLLIMDDPSWGYTLLDVSKVFVDNDFRNKLLKICKNYLVVEFWSKQATDASGELYIDNNMITWITSKLNHFVTNDFVRPIIAQSKSEINFKNIMDTKKILIVNLSKGRLGEASFYFLGMILITKLLLAAFSRANLPEEEKKDFYLYLDDFQNFAFKSVANILPEASKYRLVITLAHQYIREFPKEIFTTIFSNVGTIISFRIGFEDSEFFEKQFAPVFSWNDLINLPNYNAYIKMLINDMFSKPFNIKTFLSEKTDHKKVSKIIKISMLKYGRPREEIEKEISEKYASYS